VNTAVQDVPPSDMHVLFYLPTFPLAVLYSQPNVMAARSMYPQPARPSDAGSAFEGIFDPEVARAAAGQDTNPCEIKALQLSQASGITGADRCVS
jgi:hypothetical protein